MKLTKTIGSITQEEDRTGFFSLKVEHEIKSSRGSAAWMGPKIDPDSWHQALAFMKWVCDETGGEAVLRMYVNERLGRWGFWAYPQEITRGLSAKNTGAEETPEQSRIRHAFWGTEPSGDWFCMGTVHSHAKISAGQSGVDEADEKKMKDGLHITVGRLDEALFDLHARFYRKGMCFEPDMSQFWEVGNVMEQVPEHLRWLIPETSNHQIAVRQMCQPPPAHTEFPQAWKDNMVEVRTSFVTKTYVPGGFYSNHGNFGGTKTIVERQKEAARDLIFDMQRDGVDPQECAEVLSFLAASEIAQDIQIICDRHNIDADDLSQEMKKHWKELEESQWESGIQKEQCEHGFTGTCPTCDNVSLA